MTHSNHTMDNFFIDVKVKAVSPLLGDTVPLPEASTKGSAGLDLRACIEGPIRIAPSERQLIATGMSIELPGPHVAAFIFARSGLASRDGIALANSVGVIDSDYRGEVKVPLQNNGTSYFTVQPGDRIAQMVLMPVYRPALHFVDALGKSERGSGGFGHTGVK